MFASSVWADWRVPKMSQCKASLLFICVNMVLLTRHCQGRAAQDFLEGGKALAAFCSVAADSACCRRRSVSASINSHTSAAERDVASCIQH